MSYELCLKCNESRRRRSEMRLPLRAAQSNAGVGSPVERGQTVDWNSSWAHGSRALAVLRWSWLLSQMMGHRSGPDGRTGLHPRHNPLERQGRFAPQPGGNSLKKSAVDLQALTTIQQNNFASQPPPARVPITLTVYVTSHPSTTSRQHFFHRTAPLYMKRRIFFRSALQSW